MRDDQYAAVLTAAQTVLRTAELIITKQDGFWSSEWVLGPQLLSACWVPKQCQNPPRGAERFLGCGNFSSGEYLWENIVFPRLTRETKLACCDDDRYVHPSLERALEKWINEEPFMALRFDLVGVPWMYRGRWHIGKNCWMMGPKVRRPGC